MPSAKADGLAAVRQGDGARPCHGGSISSCTLVPPNCPPRPALNRPGTPHSPHRPGIKESPGQDTARPPTPTGAVLCPPPPKRSAGDRGTDRVGGWGGELGPLLHHHFTQLKPCAVLLPSPSPTRLPVLALTQGPGAQARMPAPRHKRSVFIFKAGCCPLRICPLEDSACDCTPCLESKRDRRQPLAGDVSKYEPGTKSQVPRPPLPWETQPGFLRQPGGRGLGAGRIRRQPAETTISPGNIACTPPGLPASLREEKGLPCIQKV